MKHIIFGILAIALGLWGIVQNWWAFLDLVNVVLPILLVVLGAVALAAGISSQLKTEPPEETAATAEAPPASRASGAHDAALPSS